MKPPKRLLAIIILAFVGLLISLIQVHHFIQVRSGLAGFKSFCTVGAFNCDVIDLSDTAELVFGIPLSAFAGAWLAAELVIALIARDPFWRRDAIRALFAMTGFGALMSFAYLGVMAYVLKQWCLLCLVIDVINVSLFALVFSLKPEWIRPHRPESAKYKVFAGIIVTAIIVLSVSAKMLDRQIASDSEMDRTINEVLEKPAVSIHTDPGKFPTLGPNDAPVTIVKFSDFQCPFCKISAHAVHPLVEMFKGQVRIVFRNFPLSPLCNREVEHNMHQAACEAGRAAICAHQQGVFGVAFETLFEHQEDLAPGVPEKLVLELEGVKTNEFKACMESDESKSAISQDVEEGILLGVQSTPTFFINGRKVEGYLTTKGWERLIKRLLKP